MTGLPWDAAVSYGDPRGRRPVFVVGMNGSGTTMLVDCLDKHPALYGFPLETRLIPHLVRVARRYEPLGDDDNFRRFWDYAAGLTPFRLVSGGSPQRLPPDWQTCTRDVAGLLNMLFLTFAQRQDKWRWCEKSPQYAQHLAMLGALFPHAMFIHVVRDGRDCACSLHRRWRLAPALTMVRWKQLMERARTQGRTLGGRYLEIRYEQLTAEPALWMRRVCAFLGEPFDPAVLQSSQPYLTGMRDYRRNQPVGHLERNSGRWREYFPLRVQERLERIGGRTLAELGYPTSHPQGDELPPRWLQRWWMLSGGARQFLHEVNAKLHGRIERPWWSILSRPVNARRQRRENVV
jgi:hypothetical protein